VGKNEILQFKPIALFRRKLETSSIWTLSKYAFKNLRVTLKKNRGEIKV
jgi:hypothetical protein